jgi:hypothetical protein
MTGRSAVLVFGLVAVTLGAALPSIALEPVTVHQAGRIAANWISLVCHLEGGWGEFDEAAVREVVEYRPEGRLLGYCCHVDPRGYIIVPLYEGLAPVKAYSATCDFDPEIGGSIANVLSMKMQCIQIMLEELLGPLDEATLASLGEIAEVDYSEAWSDLDVDPARFEASLGSSGLLSNYHTGDALLTSSWHQGSPYHVHCPAPPGDDDCDRAHCSVGCVALAGAMIMHYWCWPPGYDWANMPDRIDEFSPWHEIDPIATLCSQIGTDLDMAYCAGKGCASSCDTDEMIPLYRMLYGYSWSCTRVDRDDHTQDEWFNLIRAQIDMNRPVQYRYPGHSLVADGWKIATSIKWLHLNMGWDGGKPASSCWNPYEGKNTNTWYAVDGIPCSQLIWEYVLTDIYPITAAGPILSGVYPKDGDLRYTYIDRDAAGIGIVFFPDHHVQFVRGVRVASLADGGVLFYGIDGTPPLRLYARGDPSKGARLDNGVIFLHQNGCLKLY